jgi:hypothetical protein
MTVNTLKFKIMWLHTSCLYHCMCQVHQKACIGSIHLYSNFKYKKTSDSIFIWLCSFRKAGKLQVEEEL